MNNIPAPAFEESLGKLDLQSTLMLISVLTERALFLSASNKNKTKSILESSNIKPRN